MTNIDRIKLQRHAVEALKGLEGVEQILGRSALDAGLRHLVKLRASQINGCAYCVDMHTREARQDGETTVRLDRLVVWRDVDCFTAAERAALAWTEAVTRLDDRSELERLRGTLTAHFNDEEIGALTVAIAMINVWNRLQIASHSDRQALAA